MTEPTSALTFEDLIVEVALRLSLAYYGANGDEEPQVPQNAHDLFVCKRHVNNGIRLFLSDAPANGWRWARPTASLSLWPSVAVAAATTVTGVYEPSTNTTLITASAASFYPSMEGRTLTVTTVSDLTISSYVSATQVRVSGANSWSGSNTFSITADGDYTLPQTFGGQFTGPITYEADTNTGATIEWSNESVIRRFREPATAQTGYPFIAAVRRFAENPRRWEFMVYPTPAELLVVEFPYELYFDNLVNMTDTHPAGFVMDEVIKAACFAVAERDEEDAEGRATSNYRTIALPNALKIDARSAPRKLGYAGDGHRTMSQDDYRRYIQRPTVTFIP